MNGRRDRCAQHSPATRDGASRAWRSPNRLDADVVLASDGAKAHAARPVSVADSVTRGGSYRGPVPIMFSIELVQASERLSFAGKPRRLTVSISSSPSRMLADTGRLLGTTGRAACCIAGHSGRSCPVETGLPGWACRIRTSESVREPPNWICVTTSREVGAGPAARPFAYEGA